MKAPLQQLARRSASTRSLCRLQQGALGKGLGLACVLQFVGRCHFPLLRIRYSQTLRSHHLRPAGHSGTTLQHLALLLQGDLLNFSELVTCWVCSCVHVCAHCVGCAEMRRLTYCARIRAARACWTLDRQGLRQDPMRADLKNTCLQRMLPGQAHICS